MPRSGQNRYPPKRRDAPCSANIGPPRTPFSPRGRPRRRAARRVGQGLPRARYGAETAIEGFGSFLDCLLRTRKLLKPDWSMLRAAMMAIDLPNQTLMRFLWTEIAALLAKTPSAPDFSLLHNYCTHSVLGVTLVSYHSARESLASNPHEPSTGCWPCVLLAMCR